MPGLVGPEHFPIRDPKDTKQVHGRIVNPVRMQEIGGLDAQGKWHKDHNTSAQSDQANKMTVEKATNVGKARSTAGKNED